MAADLALLAWVDPESSDDDEPTPNVTPRTFPAMPAISAVAATPLSRFPKGHILPFIVATPVVRDGAFASSLR
jgi:hypothetical protein